MYIAFGFSFMYSFHPNFNKRNNKETFKNKKNTLTNVKKTTKKCNIKKRQFQHTKTNIFHSAVQFSSEDLKIKLFC